MQSIAFDGYLNELHIVVAGGRISEGGRGGGRNLEQETNGSKTYYLLADCIIVV